MRTSLLAPRSQSDDLGDRCTLAQLRERTLSYDNVTTHLDGPTHSRMKYTQPQPQQVMPPAIFLLRRGSQFIVAGNVATAHP